MNPYPLRELNGELRQDWGPTAGLIRNLQPLGGPFVHRFANGICRVCGYDQPGGSKGCPAGVSMATLKDIKRPTLPGQVEAAAAALRAIWAAEKARTEDAN